MKLTPLVEKSIRKAAVLHDGIRRVGEDNPPYVTHLFSVAAILSEHTDDEEIIAAGLLHDSLEDTPYDRDALARDFGERVAAIVAAVTEPKIRERGKIPWRERKEAYLEHLRSAPPEALLVAAADKIHNLGSILAEYRAGREAFFEKLKPGPAEQLWFFGRVEEIVAERLGGPIVEEFSRVYTEARRALQS